MKIAVTVLCVLCVLGCKDEAKTGQPERPVTGESSKQGGAGGQDDEAAGDAGSAAGPTEAERNEAIAETLAAVPTIQKEVAEIRKLAFDEPVPAEFQEQEDFRKFVVAEIERELPPDESARRTRALHRVGLLASKEVDLATLLRDALVSQAGAYYDPKQKKFFVVMVSQSPLERNTITAHELAHALQDQHFDLEKYYMSGSETPLSDDASNARRFVVEGEATLLMLAHAGKSMANLDILDTPAIKAQLDMMAEMSIDQLVAMTRQQAASFAEVDPAVKKALDSLDEIPLYILVPLLDSYMKGALPVYQAYKAGGWEAVARLYRQPPDSTEQVLHPADKLVGRRDYPVAMEVPGPEGWTEVHDDVIGELGWRVYFMLWKAKDPEAAAGGWDGDRIAVFEKGDELVGLIATTWDSAAEAREFETAYRSTLERRYPEGPKVQVLRRGSDVLIVDGSADPELLGHLRQVRKRAHPAER